MGKSLSSDSARVVRRSSKKKRRDVQRRTRGSASLPAPAERLGPIISTVHTNDSTLTRNKGLLVSPFLELFLDRSDARAHFDVFASFAAFCSNFFCFFCKPPPSDIRLSYGNVRRNCLNNASFE